MVIAILLAAGQSIRFIDKKADNSGQIQVRRPKNKLLAPVLGKPLFYYTLQAIHDQPQIDDIYIAVHPTTQKAIRDLIKRYHFPKVRAVIEGGKNRQQSFENVFASLKKCQDDDIILVHNGANPSTTEQELTELIDITKKNGAAAVGHYVTDTLKEIENGRFTRTLPREKMIALQTPQAAHYYLFKKALNKAKKEQKHFTDETSLLEYAGQEVKFVPASHHNFKITTQRDYEHFKHIMGDMPQDFLVGFGQDSHAFVKNKKGMWLGGIFLKNEPKFDADSDGDVLLHALCNALSQAIGQMSLGHFATPLYREKNIRSSKVYLATVLKKMRKQNYELNNLGIMLEGRIPAIDPLISPLKKSLTGLLRLSSERIGITATTGKKLTSFGKGKGLQCFAIVSLKSLEKN